MTRNQWYVLSFFIGQWQTCRDKQNPYARQCYEYIFRKYTGRWPS